MALGAVPFDQLTEEEKAQGWFIVVLCEVQLHLSQALSEISLKGSNEGEPSWGAELGDVCLDACFAWREKWPIYVES